MRDIDCKKCGGIGLLKGRLGTRWATYSCDRCMGFGVDPDAKPAPTKERGSMSCPLCNDTGNQRYWEGRWRDEKAENERLRDHLLSCRCPGGGWNGMGETEPTIKNCMAADACGCVHGDLIRKIAPTKEREG